MSSAKREECPACGGAGGGPFGRANSGWDVETYECPRCEGWGYIRETVLDDEALGAASRPGLVKTSPEPSVPEKDGASAPRAGTPRSDGEAGSQRGPRSTPKERRTSQG